MVQSSATDFGAQVNKIYHCFHHFPIYLPWSDGIAMFFFLLFLLSDWPQSVSMWPWVGSWLLSYHVWIKQILSTVLNHTQSLELQISHIPTIDFNSCYHHLPSSRGTFSPVRGSINEWISVRLGSSSDSPPHQASGFTCLRLFPHQLGQYLSTRD